MSVRFPSTDIQTFSAPGAANWTKPKGAKWVIIQLIAAGGGGQPGLQAAPGAISQAPGAQGGGYGEIMLPASILGNIEVVTIGAGGTAGIFGGAAAGNGGNSFFGNWIFVRGGAIGGVNGRGAGFPGAQTAAQQINFQFTGGDPNLINNTGWRGGAGGGTGGGFSSAVATIVPNPGGSTQPQATANPGAAAAGIVLGAAGGLAGAPNGGNGNDTIPGAVWGGSGGGGGQSIVGAAGGNGGNGVKGGGAGAGGAAFTGFNPGNGGVGGNGFAMIITLF